MTELLRRTFSYSRSRESVNKAPSSKEVHILTPNDAGALEASPKTCPTVSSLHLFLRDYFHKGLAEVGLSPTPSPSLTYKTAP